MKADKILVVVDVQRDFFSPEGSLYVKGSETLPAKIAAIAPDYDLVVFTLDWHPATHCSFAAQGGPWPSNCVAYTQGAGLSDEFCEILSSKGERAMLHFKGSEEGSKTRNDNQQYYNKFFHYKNMPPSLKLKEGRKPLVFILFYQSNCRIRIVLETYLQPLGVIVQEVEHVDR